MFYGEEQNQCRIGLLVEKKKGRGGGGKTSVSHDCSYKRQSSVPSLVLYSRVPTGYPCMVLSFILLCTITPWNSAPNVL
jgi:hypothetical protein